MNLPTFGQALASGRNFVSYGMGIATALGIIHLTAAQSTDIATDLDHIFNGLKEVAVGAGPLIALVMGWLAARKASLPAQVASVQAAAPEALAQAVAQVSPAQMVTAVANSPAVQTVLLAPTPAGRALSAVTPDNVSVAPK